MPPKKTAPLSSYRAKRDPTRTPEPFGSGSVRPSGALFVVQQHAASHLHFDLRLEVDGVLKSWAVPKGPSDSPADKRFAAETEDHPLDYADFEGNIPAGNYGAGQVIVWDRGHYVPLTDMADGYGGGKLLFELYGHKLRGRWTLVRLRSRDSSGREWLLIKERDAYANESCSAFEAGSVLSGVPVEQLTPKALAALSAKLTRAAAGLEGSRRASASASTLQPMLAVAGDANNRKGWLWELKYDGYRIIASKQADDVTLRTRNGLYLTERFPEITRVIAHLPVDDCVIDGELVVLDESGRPDFARMQARANLNGSQQVVHASIRQPATYYCFDLLQLGGWDLRPVKLAARKQLLKRLLPKRSWLVYSEHVPDAGLRTFQAARELGMEGVVGKRADARYRAGRSSDWIKVRAMRSDDFAIVGWSPARNNSTDIGAVALAEHHDGTWRYVGHAGSGLSQQQRATLKQRLRPLARKTPPIANPDRLPVREIHWVTPKLVVEVAYAEYTAQGLLRQPSVQRLREDKTARECHGRSEVVDAATTANPVPEAAVTNADKVLFAEAGHTKQDLVNYYRRIAPWILPYLADRCVVVTRFPDGYQGKSFFQRNVPDHAPAWIGRQRLWSETEDGTRKETSYFVIEKAEDLAYLANMAVLPIHMWHSRMQNLDHPDWCVLDLDPKQAPFADVVTLANSIGEICECIGLPAYPKTSGASGMHVLLPLGGQLDYGHSRTLGELIARLVVERNPDVATVTRSVRARHGKVYVDYLQNGRGQLIAAPFCVRATAVASVSMPLSWHEVNRGLRPEKYHIGNALRRMQRLGKDPGRPVLTDQPDLERSLARLAELLNVRLE